MEDDLQLLERITVTSFNTDNIYDNVVNVNRAIKNVVARNRQLEALIAGKTIHELGISDLYKEKNER